MKKYFQLLGLSTCLLAAVVFLTGLSHDALAQNASGNQTAGGLGLSTNATGATSSPEAMNNTLYPAGPQNETVITK
jgi:hypothetical protein